MYPKSRHWHQPDLSITRKSQLINVLTITSYHSADCDTNNSLVCRKVRLTARKTYNIKFTNSLRTNTAMTFDPTLCAQFAILINMSLDHQSSSTSSEEIWKVLPYTIHSTALTHSPRKRSVAQIGWKNAYQQWNKSLIKERSHDQLKKDPSAKQQRP